MAGHLNISFEDLRAKGQQLMAKADELQVQLNAIAALARPEGIWDGAAATAYQAEFERWSMAERTTIDALREMGSFLQVAANAYEGTDREIELAVLR